MNSPIHKPPPDALGERVARLEGTMERVLEEIRELRADFRQLRDEMHRMRDEMHREFTGIRAELRIISGTMIALAVAVTAAIVNLYR